MKTADSLHVGHFMALCLMKRLQMAGNKPVVLLGCGTGFIGDPSGQSDMRSMMDGETIRHNCDCFKKQMERFIEFGEDEAIVVNDADWLLDLKYVELLRDVGACFSVNNMLRAECYKQRREKGAMWLDPNKTTPYEFFGVDEEKVTSAEHIIDVRLLSKGVVIRKGKKVFHKAALPF